MSRRCGMSRRRLPASGCALLLAIVACAPTYYAIKPYYGTLDLGTRDIDAIDQGVMLEIGWSPQQRAHEKRMEQYALASLAANPGVDPLVLEALQDHVEDDGAGEDHIPFMPVMPENEEDRSNLLTYAAAALMLAGAVWIYTQRKKGNS